MSDATSSPLLPLLVTRFLVEEFVYREAALLDAWQLDEWLALFASESSYEVTPPGIERPDEISRNETYFLIGDDRKRLEHRVNRLHRPNAHAESPRSKVRHVYSNVTVTEDDGSRLTVYVNFIAFRTKRGTVQFFGKIRFKLSRSNDTFSITSKRVMMDMDNLVPHGRVSILL